MRQFLLEEHEFLAVSMADDPLVHKLREQADFITHADGLLRNYAEAHSGLNEHCRHLESELQGSFESNKKMRRLTQEQTLQIR
jgi:hypothetical protein